MAHYNDLEPCGYFSMLRVDRLLAIGWLGKGFEYRRGDPGEAVCTRLRELLVSPWEPIHFMGWHSCEFCRDNEGNSVYNLFLPGQGVTYVAPQGILHYISAHAYCPPSEFCEASLSCPDMGSASYFERLGSCGWKSYLEKLSEDAERRRTRDLRDEALQRSGDLLICRVEEYRAKTGRLPISLSDVGRVIQDGGTWQYEVLGETTVEFLQRISSALRFWGSPPQTYRLTFVPNFETDSRLVWTSEGSRNRVRYRRCMGTWLPKSSPSRHNLDP